MVLPRRLRVTGDSQPGTAVWGTLKDAEFFITSSITTCHMGLVDCCFVSRSRRPLYRVGLNSWSLFPTHLPNHLTIGFCLSVCWDDIRDQGRMIYTIQVVSRSDLEITSTSLPDIRLLPGDLKMRFWSLAKCNSLERTTVWY